VSTLQDSKWLAERVKAPLSTVRYWRHIGYGPQGIKIGKRVLYDEAVVEAWIIKQQAGQSGAA
jgi:hypothetical protein